MGANNFTSWIGVGLKGGGILGFVGFETLAGRIWNLSGMQKNDFTIGGLRLGIGLGGGFGLVGIFVFDCLNIYDLNDKDLSNYSAKPGDAPATLGISDVNVNVSLGGRWSDATKFLKQRQFANTLLKISKANFGLSPKDMDEFRNVGHHIYNCIDMASVGSGPKVIVAEVPTAGMGVEVSAYIVKGQFSVSEPK